MNERTAERQNPSRANCDEYGLTRPDRDDKLRSEGVISLNSVTSQSALPRFPTLWRRRRENRHDLGRPKPCRCAAPVAVMLVPEEIARWLDCIDVAVTRGENLREVVPARSDFLSG